MINNIFVTRPSMPYFEEYIELIQDIWNTRWLTNMGKYHNELKSKLKEYHKAKNVELFTNGHMALELSLQALDFSQNKNEIITTPFTFISTTHAIIRSGFKPVFCDINPVDFTIDTTKIESLITDKTCAIIPVHVYGNVCNIEEIDRIAKKYRLKVIYDAAHAFGVFYKGTSIVNFGDISIFSFHATKVFHTIEGGAAFFSDEKLVNKLYYLKNFGIHDAETVVEIGANAKMNEFCAAMGICNLRHIDDEIKKRKIIYERYIKNLSNIEGLQLNKINEDVKYNYAYFPVIFDENIFGVSRDEVLLKLVEKKIYARKYFYPLTSTCECFSGMFEITKTPVALNISNRVLTLPLYTDLEIDEVDKICQIILRCASKI